MNVIGPFPLYAKLNPFYSQILHVRSIWNSFKIFTVSLSAKEFANTTLKLILSKIFGFAAQTVPNPTKTRIYSPTISHGGDTCQANEKGQGHVHPISSGEQFFTVAINIPSPSSLLFYSARPLSSSSFSNPSAAATSSSPVRKSFTTSTSSPSYSRRPRISSLRRRRSCLPLPS